MQTLKDTEGLGDEGIRTGRPRPPAAAFGRSSEVFQHRKQRYRLTPGSPASAQALIPGTVEKGADGYPERQESLSSGVTRAVARGEERLWKER